MDPRKGTWKTDPGAPAFLLLLAYFALRAVYLAVSLAPSLPPDEATHLGRCELYAGSWLLPGDTDRSASLGLIGYTPYLYYFLMGKLIHLDVLPGSRLFFLRLADVVLGIATVGIAWRWIRRVSGSASVRILFILLLTNTLMFTVMSGAVSYDSLANLLAALTILYLTRFLLDSRGADLLVCLGALLAGILTKAALLPLAFIGVLCVAFHERRRLLRRAGGGDRSSKLAGGVKGRKGSREPPAADPPAGRRPPAPRAVILLSGAVVALLLALAVALYGGNLVRFGRLVPRPEQVLSEAQILQAPVPARNWIYARYRDGSLTLDEALARADRIASPVERETTAQLVMRSARRRAAGLTFRPTSRVDYAVRWFRYMAMRTYGFIGGKIVYPVGWIVSGYLGILLLAVALGAVRWLRRRSGDWIWGYMIAISGFYALVLMQGVNYGTYLHWENTAIGLQGRYIFPVIVPIYGLVAHALVSPWPRWGRIAVSILVGGWFLYGDFPFYLLHVRPLLQL